MATPPYEALRDLTPIMVAARVPQVVVVPASSPYRTLGELVAYARANPEKLNYASSGVAAAQHTAAELFSRTADVRMTHVPFRGSGQALTALIAAQVDLNFDTLPTNLPHIREGRLKALAVTTAQRVEWLPDVPTIAEQGFPDYERTVWYMLVGPANLPEPIVSRWVGALDKILEAEDTKAYLRDRGFILGGGTAADAARLLREETERTRMLVREANIRLD
jgi:tripartite-type tricarboxylate transporter receptor subunit TctC